MTMVGPTRKIFQKISLLKHSFPDTWVRKLPLLLFPADVVTKNGRIVAMCTTYKKRIILICVHSGFRRLGLASRLIKRSNAIKTDTYYHNKAALKMWKKNGFKIEKISNSAFGKKYILIREIE